MNQFLRITLAAGILLVLGCNSGFEVAKEDEKVKTDTPVNAKEVTTTGVRSLGVEPTHETYRYTYACKVTGTGPFKFEDLSYNEVKIGFVNGTHDIEIGTVELKKNADETWETLTFFMTSDEDELALSIFKQLRGWREIEGSQEKTDEVIRELKKETKVDDAGVGKIEVAMNDEDVKASVTCVKEER